MCMQSRKDGINSNQYFILTEFDSPKILRPPAETKTTSEENKARAEGVVFNSLISKITKSTRQN